jgi:hypothetical protein
VAPDRHDETLGHRDRHRPDDLPRLGVEGHELSRHAWGVAIDLNFGENSTGAADLQDPRLVEVMERWGFTWGGRWLVPDPAHFEYVAPAIAP